LDWSKFNKATLWAEKLAKDPKLARLTLGLAGLGLAAPAVISNDDRGYFKSALLTTPLIIAAYSAAPHIGEVVSTETPQFRNFFKNAKENIARQEPVSYSDIKDMGKRVSVGTLRPRQLNEALGQFYGIQANKKVSNLEEQATQLRKGLDALLSGGKEGIYLNDYKGVTRHLENVVHAELQRHGSSASLHNYKLGSVAPTIGVPGIQKVIEEQIGQGNSAFLRSMNFHLQKMQGMKYHGFSIPDKSTSQLSKMNVGSWERFGPDDIDLQAALKSQRPDLFAEIQHKIKQGVINENDISIVGRNAPLNPIVGLKIKGRNYPVVQANGFIVGGESFEKSGVSRFIATGKDTLKSDIFGIRYFGVNGSYEDVKRANIIAGADETTNFTTYFPGVGENTPGSIIQNNYRANQVVLANSTGWGEEGTQGFESLRPYEKENVMSNLGDRGLAKLGSTTLANGVVELENLLDLSLNGLSPASDQNSWIRGLTKPTTLANIPDFAAYPQARPYSLPQKAIELVGGGQVPAMGVTIGGITVEQRTFFSSLPATVAELHANEHQILADLRSKYSLNETAVHSLFKKLGNQDSLDIMRKMGTLGEGSKIIRGNRYPGLGMSTTRNFTLHELNLGDNPERLIGATFNSGDIIGYNYGNPVEFPTQGAKYTLKSQTQFEDGAVNLSFDEFLPVHQGTKGSYASTKRGDATLVTGDGEMERMVSNLNRFSEATNTSFPINSSVDELALESEIKKGEPIEGLQQRMGGVLRRMDEMGQADFVSKYQSLLSGRGLYSGQDEATLIQSREGFRNLTRQGDVLAFEETQRIANQMMEEAGARIRQLAITNPKQLNQTGRLFTSTKAGTRLDEFLQISENFDTKMVWDDTALSVARQVKLSPDIMRHLSISGHYGAVADLLERAKYEDDPAMTADFAEYLTGDKSKITNKISIREAFGGDPSHTRLDTIKGREGTIFDPNHPLAQENYLMELENGTTVPVLGHKATGGGINRYEDGQISATPHEKALFALAKGKGTEEEYIKSLNPLVYGKDSYLNAERIDTSAQAGFALNRDSTIRFADGSINPNQVGVSESFVRNLKNKELSEALLRGETGTALLIGHPIPSAPFVEMRLDPSLQANQIGVNNWRAASIHRDFDHDRLQLHPFELDSRGDIEARAEIYKQNSLQNKGLRRLSEQEADIWSELPEHGGPKLTSIEESISRSLDSYVHGDEVLKKRLVSNTIGEYSNTESMMLDMLEQNTRVTNLEHKGQLRDLFFNIYQSPISAAKAKAGSNITYEGANLLNRRLRESFDPSATFEEFHKNLMGVLQFTPESVQKTAMDSKNLLRDYHEGRTQEALRIGRARTASMIGLNPKVDIEASTLASRTVNYLSGARPIARIESTGARMAAEAIGAANDGIMTTKRVANAWSKSGANKILAAGLGIAALAGFMTTSTSSPRAKSLNNFRPETTAGTHDVPGAGVEGSYSSQPPRTRVSNQVPNVNKAIAVPIRQNTDVEVDMREDDPSRAIETAKMISRTTSSGQTIVTNNYRSNSLTSLRNKQKLRDRLEEEA
jgi:hypothetical protein